MKNKLRVAIIGYGKMGRIRSSCVLSHPGMKLVAICEVNPVKEKLDVPVCCDYREIIKFKPEVVFVCTPNKFIPDIVCFFVARGVHVFCEKPPGRTVEDVKRMLESEKSNPRIKLKFGFNHRYHEAVLDAKSIIDAGRMGKVMWMRGIYGKGGGNKYDLSWRNDKDVSGGGILIDQGIHMVDLFRFFCGEFEEVKSFITQSYWQVKVEDNAFALLKNTRGQIAMLHSSATQWQYKFLLDIYLEKGYVTISGILSSTRNYGTETLKIARCLPDDQGYPLPNPEESITYYEEDNSWMNELEEFYESITENKPVKVGSCSEAYATMCLIDKIYSSSIIYGLSKNLKESGSLEKSSFIK